MKEADKLSAIILGLLFLLPMQSACAESDDTELEAVHYAFANYLGNGIYRTSNQKVTLINLPFSYEIDTIGKFTYGLRLPVSFGFFNFNFDDIPELELPNSVGTMTFTPGIEMGYQLSEQVSLEAYLDIGMARNFTTGQNVSVNSAGISAIYSFEMAELDVLWANRVYTANYSGVNYSASDTYSAIQTGLDIGLPVKYEILGHRFQPRFFTSAFWYFNDVDFIYGAETLNQYDQNNLDQIALKDSYEFGISLKFDKVIGWSFVGIETLGIGYRFTGDFSAIRFVFSMPI